MKNLRIFLLLNVFLFVLINASNAQLPSADIIQTAKGDITIQPIFHGAMVLKLGNKTIYIDPYNGVNAYKGLTTPDLILITHIHQDHMDTVTLNGLNTSKAKIIVPQAVADRLPSKWKSKTVVLGNDKTFTDAGISITAVPMYDLPQEASSRHIKGMGNGYVLQYAGKRIYVSGDTDDIPEMRSQKNIDVAFVCMNQPFTMTVQQAASAVLQFKPKVVYPYHYRDRDGFSDIETFKKLIKETNSTIDVRIRNWYTEVSQTTRARKYEKVTYGVVSGASLTMDIYKPDNSNKIGVIIIPGTAFGYAYSTSYSQASITENFASDTEYFGKFAKTLVDRGYTIFVINHRLAPQFHYADILADCQRAVRFVRFNAGNYGIDPDNIGAFGYSSGGTLCAMLGVTDLDNYTLQTGIEAVGSKVQSVVTLAGRFDLSDFNKQEDTAIQNPIISRVLLNYVGELPMVEDGKYVLKGKYAEASPISWVNNGDASFLIYCSYDDPLVPQRQENRMYKKLLDSGVDAKLNVANNERHNPIPNIQEIDDWFLTHLKK